MANILKARRLAICAELRNMAHLFYCLVCNNHD
ncbi:hypothetical protein VCB_003413 [Vibrio cholerae TMA 21]|nr:hypothetical protein VIF_002033 [Vibrio cholerae TM 11079-80]EEO12484.1 hypothetical protein VCB_003413 [Vibrio cholerae TMA 21]